MSLLSDLLAAAHTAPALWAVDVVVGPRFSAVAAAPSAHAHEPTLGGAAYTNAGDMRSDFDPATATARAREAAVGRPLGDLTAPLTPAASGGGRRESSGVYADVGVASLNALLAEQVRARGTPLDDANGLDLIARLGSGRRLAVVGRFPYLNEVRAGAAASWVLELEPEGDELPAAAAPEVLRQADVVGITGSTLANGTLEGLLALCRPDAFVAIIGPTTPLSPILFDYGVDVLCGAIIDAPRPALEHFAASSSTRRIPGLRQVSLRRE